MMVLSYSLLVVTCLPIPVVKAFLSFSSAQSGVAFVNAVSYNSIRGTDSKWKMTAGSVTSETNTNINKSIGAIGSTLTDKELAWEALRMFVDETDVMDIQPTSGGVNNIVQYITLNSGKKLLLRIYNNGFDTPKVQFEHELLRQLNLLQANSAEKFSFQVRQFTLTSIS